MAKDEQGALAAPPITVLPPAFDDAMSASERVWWTIKTNPGCCTKDILVHPFCAQLHKPSIYAMVSKLKTSRLVRVVGKTPPGKGGKPYEMLEAVGAKYPRPTVGRPNLRPLTRPGAHVIRVRWRPDEIKALCQAWAIEHVLHDAPLSANFLKSLATMPGHGWRPRSTIPRHLCEAFLAQHSARLHEEIATLRAAQGAPAAPSAPQPLPQPHPTPPAPQEPASATQRATAPPPPASASAPSLGELIDHALCAAVRDVVAKELAPLHALLAQVLQATAAPAAPVYPAQTPGLRCAPPVIPPHVLTPPKVKRPVVVIVNAQSTQFQAIKREFPELDMRLIDGRTPSDDSADLVIGFANFMSHPLEAAIKKRFGPRYTSIFGAADKAKLVIRSRLNLPMGVH